MSQQLPGVRRNETILNQLHAEGVIDTEGKFSKKSQQ